jgi:hypothetical protein
MVHARRTRVHWVVVPLLHPRMFQGIAQKIRINHISFGQVLECCLQHWSIQLNGDDGDAILMFDDIPHIEEKGRTGSQD